MLTDEVNASAPVDTTSDGIALSAGAGYVFIALQRFLDPLAAATDKGDPALIACTANTKFLGAVDTRVTIVAHALVCPLTCNTLLPLLPAPVNAAAFGAFIVAEAFAVI